MINNNNNNNKNNNNNNNNNKNNNNNNMNKNKKKHKGYNKHDDSGCDTGTHEQVLLNPLRAQQQFHNKLNHA